MKAMILAAGRGERLKPLTAITPKPLLMIKNVTLLGRLLMQLYSAGIREVVINVHHLADQIVQYCGTGERFGLSIQYSAEETLLETGGGIFNALPLLGEAPFLVVSGDIWTSYPMASLIDKKTSSAHLVFVDNPEFHLKGDYALDENNIVRDDLPNKLTYANIGVFHPAFFEKQSDMIFKLNALLKPAIAAGKITGEHYLGEWYNVGTPVELERVRQCVQ